MGRMGRVGPMEVAGFDRPHPEARPAKAGIQAKVDGYAADL